MLRKTLMLLPFVAVSLVAAAPMVWGEEMTGELIDQLMRKQAGEVVTAESALPQKRNAVAVAKKPEAIKNDAAKVDAVKLEVKLDSPAQAPAQGPGLPQGNTIGTSLPASSHTAAGPEDQQPVFTNPAALTKDKATTSGGAMARMFGSLAIVLTIIGGAVYGLKKWPGAQKLTGRNKMIEVLSQHHLGPKKSLAIIRVAGEAVLVGVTDNNISILKTLALLDDDLPKENAAAAASVNKASEVKKSDLNFGQKFQATLASKFTKSAASTSKASAKEVGQSSGKLLVNSVRDDSQTGQFGGQSTMYNRQAKVQAPTNDSLIDNSDLDSEEFAMRGLREIVGERLKTMKEL